MPLVAVMVSVYAPGGVEAVVVTVNVDDLADASVIEIDVGLKPVVVSPEAPLTVSEMFPVNPPAGAAVTEYVVASPGLIVLDGGEADSEKSATGVASAIFAMKTSWLPAFDACKGEAVGKFVDDV